MQKLLLISIQYIVMISCGETKTTGNNRNLDFGAFTRETPNEWTIVKKRGIDSYVGKIAIDESDTLDFDLGWYSNDLAEYQEVKIDNKTYYISSFETKQKILRMAHNIVQDYLVWIAFCNRQTISLMKL